MLGRVRVFHGLDHPYREDISNASIRPDASPEEKARADVIMCSVHLRECGQVRPFTPHPSLSLHPLLPLNRLPHVRIDALAEIAALASHTSSSPSRSTSTMPSKSPRDHLLNFDIDTYLDPYIPPSQLKRLPKPIAHFLGHREHPPSEPPNLIAWPLTFMATVAGLCLVGGVYNYAPAVARWNPPVLVASLGASAVLDYNSIRSPLAQPRNTVFGHTISAIVAVAISKGFQRYAIFPSINWVAAAIACATANLTMSVTNTVHPPGGATAILACIQADVLAMGWMYVPIIMLASVLMCVVALLFNNTLRWYPTYWWTSAEVGHAYQSKAEKAREEHERRKQENEVKDLEKQRTSEEEESDVDAKEGSSSVSEDAASRLEKEIRIGVEGVTMPAAFDFKLEPYEREFLGQLQERLSLAVRDS